jgi:hypothetical protein
MNKAFLALARFGRWLSRYSIKRVNQRRHALNVQRAIWRSKQHSFVHFASVPNTALPSIKRGGAR